MAALTPVAPGVAFTPAAASASDTAPAGPGCGGWDTAYALYVIGSTATTLTIDGVNYGPITSQSILVPLRRYNGASVTCTTSQQTGVTVAIIRPATAYQSFGN